MRSFKRKQIATLAALAALDPVRHSAEFGIGKIFLRRFPDFGRHFYTWGETGARV